MVSLRTKGVMVMFSVYNSLISCWDLPFILSECEIFFIVFQDANYFLRYPKITPQ